MDHSTASEQSDIWGHVEHDANHVANPHGFRRLSIALMAASIMYVRRGMPLIMYEDLELQNAIGDLLEPDLR